MKSIGVYRTELALNDVHLSVTGCQVAKWPSCDDPCDDLYRPDCTTVIDNFPPATPVDIVASNPGDLVVS